MPPSHPLSCSRGCMSCACEENHKTTYRVSIHFNVISNETMRENIKGMRHNEIDRISQYNSPYSLKYIS